MWRGWVSRRAGLWEQAVQSMQAALKLNPRVHFNWHEYASTLMYLHRYEEAMTAVKQARVLDPDSYWGKMTEARIVLQQSGDTQAGLQLMTGAQRISDYDVFETYLLVNILARRYDDALEAARSLSTKLEIGKGLITLREDWAAQILYFMGKADEAGQAAAAALFRLKGLSAELGEDYRIDLAVARIRALQGAARDEVRTLVEKAKSATPEDHLAEFQTRYTYAQIFAIAGMTTDAIEVLESLLPPPSNTSVFRIDLDPAFDGIRDDPEFITMMERNQ